MPFGRAVPVCLLPSLLISTLALGQPKDSPAAREPSDRRVEFTIAGLETLASASAQDMEASERAAEVARGPEVRWARAYLDSLLRADSTDFRANLLYARLGIQVIECTPIEWIGGKEKPLPFAARDLARATDRAILTEPMNPEGYLWKGAACTMPITQGPGPMSRAPLDRDSGLRAFQRAVELAPDSLHYRLALASSLLDAGKRDEARETMRLAEDGAHPMYRLLVDWTRIPRPAGATPTGELMARETAERLGATDWVDARVDAFVVAGTPAEIEAFYRQHIPSFKLYELSREKQEGETVRIMEERLVWNGDDLTPVASQAEVERTDGVAGSVMWVVVSASHPSARSSRATGMPAGRDFCVVSLANLRDLGRTAPDKK